MAAYNFNDCINTVINDDCLSVMRGWPDKCVDLIVTDPPYGINKSYWDSEYPRGVEKELLRLAKTVAIMCGQWALRDCIVECGDAFVGIIALHNKNGMTFSPLGFGNWIPVIIAGEKPSPGPDHLSFVVNGDKPPHPSPKPIKAMEKLVGRLSNKDTNLILDPFAGSGTTLVAAKQLGRRFIGIEISEKYVAICKERLKQEQLDLR